MSCRTARQPLAATLEINMPDAFVEGGQLRGQLDAGIEHETRPVEHLVILPAHHVQIDQRQPRLDHARLTIRLTRWSYLCRL